VSYDVIIIGGGVAGLSSAVDLARRGISVLLLEQRPFLGGRAYSFIDETTGDVVDNGQHLLMGCYHETRRYLRMIGAEHLATLQPALHVDFLHPKLGRASLSCPNLPAPFHALVGLLNLRSLPFYDRLLLLRVGMDLLFATDGKEESLASLSVDAWLTALGQTELSKKYLWDIIAIGSLNDDPKTVSALLFYRVLRAAFMQSREDSGLLIPRVGLSELLVHPAVRFLRAHGGEVKTNCGVESLRLDGSRVSAVRSSEGATYRARAYVSAVPHYAFPRLFLREDHRSVGILHHVVRFESSPIVTIHLWLDRKIMEQEFVALLDSRVQWVFNRSKLLHQNLLERGQLKNDGRGAVERRNSGTMRQYLSLVISGAAEYEEMSKEHLVAMALEDLRRAFPEARTAHVLHSRTIKEKRATFSPTPAVEGLRPSVRTPLENLFLAGDWTNTGLPSTIEGAVASGHRAAEAVASYLASTYIHVQ